MKAQKKRELMDKYNIKAVGGGDYGEGFFDCLRLMNDKVIVLEERVKVLTHLKGAGEKKK